MEMTGTPADGPTRSGHQESPRSSPTWEVGDTGSQLTKASADLHQLVELGLTRGTVSRVQFNPAAIVAGQDVQSELGGQVIDLCARSLNDR